MSSGALASSSGRLADYARPASCTAARAAVACGATTTAAAAFAAASTMDSKNLIRMPRVRTAAARTNSSGSSGSSNVAPRRNINNRPLARNTTATAVKPSAASSSAAAADRRSPAAAAAAAALPPGDFSRVRTAVFVGSAVDLRGCPPDGRRPEFALIGRSNVGKSSLINALTGRAGLARESKEPGMTQTINHYLINDSWHLVDLPGYGYAKAAKATQGAWLGFTKRYFLERDSLVAVLLLVDATLPPQRLDVDCANWLASSEVPFAVVFTKADARKKGGPPPQQNVAAFKAALAERWASLPACFLTSARDGTGKAELLAYLASLRRLDAEEA